MDFHPDQPLRCLLLHTRFAEHSYWNYKIPCEALGVKTPSAPLGLITIAAILPQQWQFKLLDLNATEFNEELWAWADLVCIGGMLPQQKSMLEYIRRAKADKKFVAVGGSDPSSQPKLYEEADVLVLGEGENTIPLWLESWRRGEARGTFQAKEKPDVTSSPVPRFDLLNFKDYMHVGIQYSRGCPFNCEFCDIIELFGRVPRTKTAPQILRELDTLYALGYRGSIELVDDNFIGNKRLVKRELLPALISWNRAKRYPFFFNTEASMNLADDRKLLRQMRAAEFRYLFMGIESPDPEILLQTQKSQNTMGSISKRVKTLYEYGMVAMGGFIMGFDGEKAGSDKAMIKLIEETNICMAMVGLLVALPNTQLSRRLRKEGRLMNFRGEIVKDESDLHGKQSFGDVKDSIYEIVDQTNAGLNFETKRPRSQILEEYANVVSTIYDPHIYMNRVLRMVRLLRITPRHYPTLGEFKRQLRAFGRLTWWYMKKPQLRWLYIRNLLMTVFLGPYKVEVAIRMMGVYLHFEQQTAHVLKNTERMRGRAKDEELAALSGNTPATVSA